MLTVNTLLLFRPPEVGKLFSLFHYDYDKVFQKIIRSSMRNLAGTMLTVDNFRFNRTYVETQMHAMLRKRLGGIDLFVTIFT